MMIDWYPAQRHMLHFVPGLRVKIDGQTVYTGGITEDEYMAGLRQTEERRKAKA
jgi:hypothetical protein